MLLHASCVAHGGDAVLFLGPPGSGKSDLALRLIHGGGWRLVGDDQVRLTPGEGRVLRASVPAPLRGLLEVRGLGLFSGLEVAEDPPSALRLTVRLARRAEVPRLPGPETWACGEIAVPAVTLDAFEASAPAKVALALAAATGRARQAAGAFVREEGGA